MADTAEKVDNSATADVSVSWNTLKIAECTDLRNGTKVAINNNTATVKVLPGDVTILKFKNK